MKSIVLRLFTFIAILYLIDRFIIGFEITSATSAVALAALLSITQLIIKPIIKFLTFPINLLTFGIFNFFISCVLLYLYNFIVPGFQLIAGSVGPFNSSDIQVPEVKLSQIGVIILASFAISLLNSIISWTQGDGDD